MNCWKSDKSEELIILKRNNKDDRGKEEENSSGPSKAKNSGTPTSFSRKGEVARLLISDNDRAPLARISSRGISLPAKVASREEK